jgi:hypothetical protein
MLRGGILAFLQRERSVYIHSGQKGSFVSQTKADSMQCKRDTGMLQEHARAAGSIMRVRRRCCDMLCLVGPNAMSTALVDLTLTVQMQLGKGAAKGARGPVLQHQERSERSSNAPVVPKA